jgi:signal peptidase I
MFGLFRTQQSRVRHDAQNWLEVADKVYHYRRDELTDTQLNELVHLRAELSSRLKQRVDIGRLKLAIEALETVLRRHGGRVYPKTSLVDNVEFFLVAAIVILGLRAFVVQPFKIPTNSMWPSYYGMTHELYPADEPAPGVLVRAFRLIAFGAQRKEMVAPVAGEVEVPFVNREGRILVQFGIVRARKWLVLPTQLREYTFYVDGRPMRLRVPLDFDFDRLAMEAFFANGRLNRLFEQGRVRETHVTVNMGGVAHPERIWLAPTGRTVRAGETALRFDLLTGDQLFVDRLSYHFVAPKVGQGFVFRTGNIRDPETGRATLGDKYYIKRLVGVPGDTLAIRDPVLLRNGEPITGAAAFANNHERVNGFDGYRAGGFLRNGAVWEVPPDRFVALGDNSNNSLDSRYWGFVPAGDVIGRPLFIYYPFTRRWGPAR